MGQVEQAIRATFRTPATLHTLGQGKAFVLERIDHDGIGLLLGRQRSYTPLRWATALRASSRSCAVTPDGCQLVEPVSWPGSAARSTNP